MTEAFYKMRSFLMTVSRMPLHFHVGIYPLVCIKRLIIANSGPKAWKTIFYRVVDSQADEDGDEIRAIEEELFETIKGNVEKVTSSWIGSIEQNRMADQKIATLIRNSFKSYETTKESPEKMMFQF